MWTTFSDASTTSRPGLKVGYKRILIELEKLPAKTVFRHMFNYSPDKVSCSHCGPDFSVIEWDNELAAATSIWRHCHMDDDGWEDCPFKPGSIGHKHGLHEYYIPLDEFLERDDVLVISREEALVFLREIKHKLKVGNG